MVKLARSVTMLAAIGLLTACQTEPAEQTGATEEAADASGVRSEIESINDRYEQALLAQDAATIAAIYTDDAVVLPPSNRRTEGRAAIESMFTSWFGQMPPSDTFTLTSDQLVLAESGDIAYEIGTYQTSGSSTTGETYEESGKYLAVWENVDGEWKMAADMWSGDAPMHEEGEAAEPRETTPGEAGATGEAPTGEQGATEPAAEAEAES